jgi:gamma-glutamyltranspeptidase/glutathione hydrolase
MSKPYVISTGHESAATIAASVLESGGNAVDAGVAACIALSVVHSEQVQIGGICPMMLRKAEDSEIIVIDGVGRWPAAANSTHFIDKYRGRIPLGILRTVVPAAMEAWILALSRFGTKSFSELAEPAWRLADKGFPAHAELVQITTEHARSFQKFPQNARIWMPQARPRILGEQVVYPELANTLKRLIDADAKAGRSQGRQSGLQAARDLFYRGEIADQMIGHIEACNGLLTKADLAAPNARIERATEAKIRGGTLHTCGPWSQGPAVSQALMVLEKYLGKRPDADRADFAHGVIEALKLALADREGFYGDPDFVDVPMNDLLSEAYAIQRENLIHDNHTFPGLPDPGLNGRVALKDPTGGQKGLPSLDTSIVSIVDSHGNVFAATPSDSAIDAPVVPELGFVISTRGTQSFTEPGHPSILAPRKRPRATACPLIYVADDGRILAGGGPGADYQLQAMVQVLSRHIHLRETLEDALAAPRIFTQSAPTSSSPHLSFPDRMVLEKGWEDVTVTNLSARGHAVVNPGFSGSSRPSICLVQAGPTPEDLRAFGDPRRDSGQKIAI